VVEAQFPLVATITNESGDRVAHVAGWLDPAEPPTTVYGHARAGVRAGPGASVPETIVERLVGPWPAGGRQTLTVAVDLGQDRVGKARIEGARLVVYDDAMPTSIKLAFGVLGAGALSIAIAMAFVGMGAGRALLSRRGGNRRRQIV
jgi:hypothetical protein